MRSIINYIEETLSKDEQGNNILIDKTKDYNLYCGKHLFDRLNRHAEETYNVSDKIKLSWIKDIIHKGFNSIVSLTGIKLKVNDPLSCINLISSKHGTQKLNILCYIKSIEIDGTYNIIIKTTKFGNNFYLTSNKDVKKIVENILNNIININVE